jgi:hypothetical protein
MVHICLLQSQKYIGLSKTLFRQKTQLDVLLLFFKFHCVDLFFLVLDNIVPDTRHVTIDLRYFSHNKKNINDVYRFNGMVQCIIWNTNA